MAKGIKTGGGSRAGIPNKATAEIQEIARKYAPDAIKEMHRILTTSESDAARVAAGNVILDRAYGKARQPVDHGWDLTKLTDEQIAAIAVASGAASTAPPPDPRRDGAQETAH